MRISKHVQARYALRLGRPASWDKILLDIKARGAPVERRLAHALLPRTAAERGHARFVLAGNRLYVVKGDTVATVMKLDEAMAEEMLMCLLLRALGFPFPAVADEPKETHRGTTQEARLRRHSQRRRDRADRRKG